MTTTHQKPAARGRFAAATMLAAAGAGALIAGALGPVAPANANVDTYLALAWQAIDYGTTANTGPSGIGESTFFDGARVDAINDCAENGGQTGGGQCEVRVVATNECAAIAGFSLGDTKGWKWATATAFNQQLAEQYAIHNNGGGVVLVSACPTYSG